MVPKTKKRVRPSTQKGKGGGGGAPAKSSKSQPPPVLSTPQREAHLDHDKEEPTLKDVILVLGNVKSRLTAHDARLDEIAAGDH